MNTTPLLRKEVDEAAALLAGIGWRADFIERHRGYCQDVARVIRAALARDREVLQKLVDALNAYGPLRSNCHKRIEADGELNQGPTCRSSVARERTERAQWCRVCNAAEILDQLAAAGVTPTKP